MRITEEELAEILKANPDLQVPDLTQVNSKPFKRDFRPLDFDSVKPRHKPIITERDFQEWFRQLAIVYGYLFYHTHRSQFSPSGFPDNVLVRLEPEPRLIFAELKTDDLKVSQPSIDQWMWLYILQHIPGIECYLFRPSDRDFIEELLR